MNATPADADLLGDVRAAMRADLIVSRQWHGGRSTYALKEPIGLRYVHLRDEEYFILSLLDGRRSLEEVQRLFAEQFAPMRIALTELDGFVRRCLANGIAVIGTPKVGLRLHQESRKKRWAKLRQTLLNPMSFKIRLLDPDRLLQRLEPLVSWIFSRTAVLFASLFLLSTIGFALIHWAKIEARVPTFREFFGSHNLALLWLTIGAVKIVHEFGHAFACKRFGGEVHEMGFMLLVLSPALYCNVSDAWMFPRLSRRLVVGAAGIYMEALLAATAFWIWWSTEAGTLNFLALGVVAICSINTLLFNGNPLLKFDGYYLLSDAVGVPNLRKRSNQHFGNMVSRMVFGKEALPDPLAPRTQRWAFAAFAMASFAYRVFIAVGIILFLYTLLKPYKLEILSQILAWFAVLSMGLIPSIQVFRLLRKRWPAMKVHQARARFGVAAAVLVVALLLLTPLPWSIDVPCVCRFDERKEMIVGTAGVLRAVHVKDGDAVEPGQLLAELDSPDLQRRIRTAEIEVERETARLRDAEAREDTESAASSRRAVQAKTELLRLLRSERMGLVLRAPPHVRGVAVSPLKDEDVGRPLKAGTVVCSIGDPSRLHLFAVAEATDVAMLDVGRDAKIGMEGRSSGPFPSKIVRVAHTKLNELPASLSSQVKGGIVGAAAPKDNRTSGPDELLPILTSYSVTFSVENTQEPILPGVRGTARIQLDSISWGRRILRWIDQTLLFRL